MFFSFFCSPSPTAARRRGRARHRGEGGRRLHPATCVPPPPALSPYTLMPRGACPGFRCFSVMDSRGLQFQKTAGGWEATPGGKVVRTGQAGPVTLTWVTYQTSAPIWCLTLLSRWVETSPNCGWGLQKLEEAWNAQSPNLAPAPLAQPLPSLPT